MKLARLVIYEGTEKQIADQLGRSMSAGIRQGHGAQCGIMIVEIPLTIMALIDEAAAAVAVTIVQHRDAKAKHERTDPEQIAHQFRIADRIEDAQAFEQHVDELRTTADAQDASKEK